jgi:flavin-dependent dehydrogenase
MPYAWQVRRSELDQILFRHAAACGATTVEGCRVRELRFDADGADVQAQLDDGRQRRWRARFVVDASGRDTLIANQIGSKQRNPKHNSAALFGHFRGAKRLEGRLEGNISIFWFQHGWFWFIPLSDGTTSVGATCWPHYLKSRSKPLADFFADTIAMCPPLAERLQGAELVDGQVHATGNYSYGSTVCQGDRWLMLGDAYAFVDPVFSSGVLLAMASAEMGSEVADAWLDDPARAAPLARAFEGKVKRAIRTLSWLIYRINTPVLRDMFMAPSNRFRMRDGLISLLAGDVHANANRQLPVLAFKAAYHGLSIAYRLGWRLGPAGLARAGRTAPAPALKAPAAG